jgi:vitamin B12 transporter
MRSCTGPRGAELAHSARSERSLLAVAAALLASLMTRAAQGAEAQIAQAASAQGSMAEPSEPAAASTPTEHPAPSVVSQAARASSASPASAGPAASAEDSASIARPKSRPSAPVVPSPTADSPALVAPGAYETVVRTSSANDPRPREDAAASASTITSDRTPRSGESLPQLLNELPGANVTRLGGLGALATVSLRGSSSNQVLVYLDGVPLNSAAGGGVDLSAIPLADVERIEIYRGMSPIAFGASAIGGVISITTRAPRENAAAGEVGLGSFTEREAGARGSWVGERVRLYGGGHVVAARGDFPYRSDNGTLFDTSDDRDMRRENNALEQFDGIVRASVRLNERQELIGSFSLVARKQGLPGPGTYTTREASLATTRAIATLVYRWRDERDRDDRVRVLVYGDLLQQRLHDPLQEVELVPVDTHDTGKATGATWLAQVRATSWLLLRGVLNGRYETFQPRDMLRATPVGAQASRGFAAAGIEAQASAPARLDIIPSFRLELSRDAVAGRSYFSELLPASPPVTRAMPLVRLALLKRLSEAVTLRANVGRYARLPSSAELYGDNGFLLGNTTLAPESGLNVDAGAALELASASYAAHIDIAAFGARITDLIQFEPSSPARLRAENVGSARVVGLEVSAQLRVGAYAHAFAQVTLADTRDTSSVRASRGRQLPLRPRARAYSRLEARRVRLGAIELGAYADADLTSGNYIDPPNLIEIPARIVFGAGGYAGTPGGHARLVVSAQNLGNSTTNDLVGFPLPGRALFVTFSASTSSDPSED